MLTKFVRTSPLFGCCANNALLRRTPSAADHRLTKFVRHGHNQRWQRAYLKDLYHRRVLAGPEPLMSRASQDNWNYTSEICALSHRLCVPDLAHDAIVRALTNQSFFGRKDLEGDEMASRAQPSMDEHMERTPCNEALAEQGLPLFRHIILSYLRAHWPSAPEEFIVAVAARIASSAALADLAAHLGLRHVVRTGEFPPSDPTLHAALFALVATMGASKARDFVRRFVLPRLLEVPLEDVLPFRHPFPVLCDYMRKWKGISDLEVRTIDSGATSTAMPFYEIAIFANKQQIVGQSGGESAWVALDLASQNGLLRLWEVDNDRRPRVFPFKFEQVYEDRFGPAQKPNHALSDVCSENTDLSLYTSEELARDPIDQLAVTKRYFTETKPKVGVPHRRRLRHSFSRGTINRMSFRAFVRPMPHNI